ncbi:MULTISPECIES: hypothetical protein [Methanosarcina]|nr:MULTISPECIES: hypothetical protein [Methanosarcina]
MNPAFSKNYLPATLFKKLLARNPFQKRLDRKPRHSSNKVVGMINRRND